MTVSEWADANRKLSSESSAEPGQWNTSRAEYQRGIMDAMSEPGVNYVVVMTSAQVGKTEMLNNLVGYHIDQDPSPLLFLQPTLDMAETWSKDRFAPMVRDTPCLKRKISDSKSRDSGNTILHKNFSGGHLTAVGANSPSSLASRPIRVVLADELDRYPPSAGAEGDPFSLAVKRTTAFWNRRIMTVSTPTIKGFSRIEIEYESSDKRRYSVPCHHCGHCQYMVWERIQWENDDPRSAKYYCEECGVGWSEYDRLWAVRRGTWVATNPNGYSVGFHLNELYSPWSTIVNIATSFVKAQKSDETKKTWWNTVLGLPYESDAERIDYHALAEPSRHEDFDNERAPLDVLLVTCGVDVQGNRLEIERVGWGVDEESWSLDYHVLHGDPSDPELWRRLDAYLEEPTIRVDERVLPVRATCIDSGGHHTQQVYKYVRLRRNRGVHAIKGREEPSVVWPAAQSQKTRGRSKDAISIGVRAGKDAVYAQLRTKEPGPGYPHFPLGREQGWFEQLTAENVETRYLRGFPKRVYVLPEGRRNEALDCRVYAYAALHSLRVRWGTELRASTPLSKKTPKISPEIAAQSLQRDAASSGAAQPILARAPARQGSSFLSRGGSSGGWLRRR